MITRTAGVDVDSQEVARHERFGTEYFQTIHGTTRTQEKVAIARFLADYMAKVVPHASRLLDVGCGLGFTLQAAAHTVRTVVGLDLSEHALYRAKARAPLSILFRCDIGELFAPFKPGTFDLVTAFDILEHLKSPDLLARTSRDLLRDRGAFLGTTPNEGFLGRGIFKDRDATHISKFTPGDLRGLLEAAGFSPVNVTGVLAFALPFGENLRNRLDFSVVKPIMTGLYPICQELLFVGRK